MRIYWGAQRCSSHTSFTSSPSFIRMHSGKLAVAPPMWMCMLSNDGAPSFFFSVNLQQKNSSVPHNSHTVKSHTLLYEIKPLTLLAVHYNRSSSICTPWALQLYWYSSIIYNMLSIGVHFSLWLLRIIVQNPSTLAPDREQRKRGWWCEVTRSAGSLVAVQNLLDKWNKWGSVSC